MRQWSVALKHQSKTKESNRPLSAPEEGGENVESVSTIASQTVCQAQTDIVSEKVTSNNKISILQHVKV